MDQDGAERTLSIESYTQQSGGTLELDFASIFPGGHDALEVEGNAILGGVLSIDFVGAFTPAPGNTFEILTTEFGNVGGVFDGFNIPVFDGMTLRPVYNPKSVVLEVVAILSGDYNDDGRVDAADYTVWRDRVGAAAGTLPNDPNPGPIGSAQYITWRDNYGALPVAAAGESTSAPEPTTMLMMLVGGSLTCVSVRPERRI